MGYDLRITRAIDWTANRGHQITVGEWLQMASVDTELFADPGNGPYAMRYRTNGWFDWYDGNVFTSDPDRATVAKLLLLAKALDGIVQGDDGEIYENALQWPRVRKGSNMDSA